MLNATDRTLATRVIQALAAGGFCLFGHSDDGHETVTRNLTATDLLSRLGGVDDEIVIVYDANGKRVGGLFFVWGNGEGEALSDYSWNAKHPEYERYCAIVDSATGA